MDYDLILFTDFPYAKSEVNHANFDVLEDSGKLKLCKSFAGDNRPLEELILEYINLVEAYNLEIFFKQSALQLGAFQPMEETTLFTVELSATSLSFLADRSVSLSITVYPCSD